MEIIVVIAYGLMLVAEFALEFLGWIALALLGLIYGLIQSIVEGIKERKKKKSEENL